MSEKTAKELVYESEISSLVEKIGDICYREKIAMVVGFSIGDAARPGLLMCSFVEGNDCKPEAEAIQKCRDTLKDVPDDEPSCN